MNGEVNGTMEEPVELSIPASPDDKEVYQKVTADEVISSMCDVVTNNSESNHSNNTECNNLLDSEKKNCSSDKDMVDDTAIGDRELLSECAADPLKDVSEQEYCTDNLKNECGNSNESYPESTHSWSGKSTTELVQNNCKDQQDDNCNKNRGNEMSDELEDYVQNSKNEVYSEDSSGDDESVESREQNRAEDTVSINSDTGDEDDTSQESQTQNKNKDIIILDSENQPGSQNGNSGSHEVHEIDSDIDDCVVAIDEKKKEKVDEGEKVPLRRSSRAIKRKRYNIDMENIEESDIEEIEFQDPSHRRSKPIVINDTKALVEMAAKQMKNGNNQKKEPTVVIIDTNSVPISKGTSLLKNKNSIASSNSTLSAQSLYQSIVARGTTVTPVSSKNITSTQVTQNTQPVILPSLTDDMFVVEAPSFIVPYVYEKPSIKPFREFVFKLGKELEEQRLKDEKDQPDTKELQDNITDQESNGELQGDESESTQNIEDSEDTATTKKKKKERKDRKKADDDDASWDGESASESDDALSDEEDKIVVKDKTEPIDQIKNVTELTADKIISSKTSAHSSMDCSLGKFFINIGLNLVQEYVQTDLLKQQNRKLYKEKKSGQNIKATESSIVQLMKNLEFSKENNAPYAFSQKKCELCSFKSESMLVMAHHLETPHMRNNLYKCNYCPFEVRSPHDILYHMEAEHNVRGKLERAPAYHQCANCPFEDNGKGKLARHLIACAKKFKPDMNLAPPVDWEPPAKLPKISKPRNTIMGPYQNTFNRGQLGNNITRTPVNIGNMVPGMGAAYRPRGRSPMGVSPRGPPVHGIPILRPGPPTRHTSPILLQSNFPNNVKSKSHQPSISITPLPRQPQPQVQQTQNTQQSKSSFVICEICDGYIKDLEQLRNHMQWIHKVKIHPKMIYNRPPLNCQKCQFRFFTDQGLERHLLGTHGLVTSSMQEAANKGKDAGRCPVCGRVYQWKLLNHVARDHSLTLKPAHLSYKCTVCTATFGMYKQFENHVYSAHSVVAKRVMDKSKTSMPAKATDTRAKSLKINDEITIIPQHAKSSSTAAKDK